MKLVLQNIKKSYEGKILFSNLNLRFEFENSYAVVGKNGSGKTTLLKVIMGFSKPDNGAIYWENRENIKTEISYSDFAFSGIQQQLFEDLTVLDIIKFHFKFRTPIDSNYKEVIKAVFNQSLLNKKANQLSAGWLNRLKLLLSILTQSKVLILDEPFSNMDEDGIEKFVEIIKTYSDKRILIVAGNREDELAMCNHQINLN